ncbi:MAG: nitroreductase family deazaflavin-dependent oxidoreductase [Microthrixaceae bacterium]
MKVLLTGATGFVGGHTMAELLRNGHEVTALVRDPARLAATADSLGVDTPRSVVGDMTDPERVRTALAGVDGVVHCAAVVSIDRRRAAEMVRQNRVGTETVLRAAVEAGCDPVIHVSSTSALFQRGCGPLTPEHPVASSSTAYGRSKAESERVARALQAEGAPVVITYPSGIIGPPAGSAFGETSDQVAKFVAGGMMPTRAASLSMIDVRDLAALTVALLEPGRGPRRIMTGGHLVDMDGLAHLLRELTGRRFPVPPVPPAALRTMGVAVDRIARVVPFDSPVGEESMTLVTCWEGTDDRSAVDAGRSLRPLDVSLRESMEAWHTAGMITDRHAGRLVTPAGPPRGIRLPGWVMASGPLRWLGPRVFPRLHRGVMRVTGGRTMLDSRAQPMLLLRATGARTGQPRSTPLATVPLDDGTFLVVGSNFAQESHPAWTSNLLAHPEATVTFHGSTLPVTARLLTGADRERRWAEALRWYPGWRRYEEVTDREFRIFELRPTAPT